MVYGHRTSVSELSPSGSSPRRQKVKMYHPPHPSKVNYSKHLQATLAPKVQLKNFKWF